MAEERQWIENVELEDVKVKWSWSNFEGREARFNREGDHNFIIVLPEDVAYKLADEGWAVKTYPGLEEGDPPDLTLKVNISYKYEPPMIFFIINDRKMRVGEEDLRDIRRSTCQRLDVVLQPSRWVRGDDTGISAYAKELYAVIKVSRFATEYQDLEEIT